MVIDLASLPPSVVEFLMDYGSSQVFAGKEAFLANVRSDATLRHSSPDVGAVFGRVGKTQIRKVIFHDGL